MRKKYSDELTPDARLKVKKNLVYVAIFSIVMLFAGFTSAYIVSMGDTFWMKYPLPSGFWFSTAAIAISSVFYVLAVRKASAESVKPTRMFMILTLVAGLCFVFFQWKGYGQLVDRGANPVSQVTVTKGRYGDYFKIKYQGQMIEVNANDYLINGKVLTEKQMGELKDFLKRFEHTVDPKGYQVNEAWSSKFTLLYQDEPVSLEQGKLRTVSGKELGYIEMRRLRFLYWNVRDGRGDFFYKGKLGKDFQIYYKGKELTYKDRQLYFENKRLSAPLQLKINQASDTASAFLYIITILHLLHVAAALIYLFRMVLITLKPTLTIDNQISIRLGGIFWHFLGILWLYLLVFLLFIH
ncbi:MAG: hypothetical protein EP338_06415 [Bacteroidetes bacterium]|nr:MAG: hypothetical protein EP338_06415 [Bacteroidota bacterium]